MYQKSILTEAIIKGRIASNNVLDDDHLPYVVEQDYDKVFRYELQDGLVYLDSSRGTNPFGGQEAVVEEKTGANLWICDYAGYMLSERTVEMGEIFGLLRLGRRKYLEKCINSIVNDLVYEDKGYYYSIRSIGTFSSLLQIETVGFKGIDYYFRLCSCMLRG
jgi:hypothetical protein